MTTGRVHWETVLASNGFKRRGGGQRNTYWHVNEGPAGPGLFVKTTPKKLEVIRRQRAYGRQLLDYVVSSDFYGALSKQEENVVLRLHSLFKQPTQLDPSTQADIAYGDLIKSFRKFQRVDWDAFGDLAVTLAAYRGKRNVFARAFRDAWDQRDEELARELLADHELITQVRRDITHGPADLHEEAQQRQFMWVPGRRHFWFGHYILRGSGPPAGLRTDAIAQGARREPTGWRAIGVDAHEFLSPAYDTAEEAVKATRRGDVE
jgi:hypothetical protein